MLSINPKDCDSLSGKTVAHLVTYSMGNIILKSFGFLAFQTKHGGENSKDRNQSRCLHQGVNYHPCSDDDADAYSARIREQKNIEVSSVTS